MRIPQNRKHADPVLGDFSQAAVGQGDKGADILLFISFISLYRRVYLAKENREFNQTPSFDQVVIEIDGL